MSSFLRIRNANSGIRDYDELIDQGVISIEQSLQSGYVIGSALVGQSQKDDAVMWQLPSVNQGTEILVAGYQNAAITVAH